MLFHAVERIIKETVVRRVTVYRAVARGGNPSKLPIAVVTTEAAPIGNDSVIYNGRIVISILAAKQDDADDLVREIIRGSENKKIIDPRQDCGEVHFYRWSFSDIPTESPARFSVLMDCEVSFVSRIIQ